MRILFAASPAIAVPSLGALSEMELEGGALAIAGILTNPDRCRKHGYDEPTDVSAAALALDPLRKGRGLPPIPQLKPEKLDGQAREEVSALAPDLLVSFAYGRIFGPRFLDLFPMGGINIHPSLLPRYRGATPIQAAILARERETGICIQKISLGMDEGDILAQEIFGLTGRETAVSLSCAVGDRAAAMLRKILADFAAALAAAQPQQGQASYCRQIRKEEGIIDWGKSAAEIDAQIRAYTPWPLSVTNLGKDALVILEAQALAPQTERAAVGTVLGTDKEKGILIQTGDGVLAVSRLQWQAKKPLDWKAFCNGARGFIGAVLGKPQ
ncbi:MAG: methionyl-tRNA formyltransferase [Treponema sp.]|nr:methionyl-tRNA formyltransferase [Treponema sp.]